MSETSPGDEPAARSRLTREALDYIENALRGLRYGSVTVVVQDGVVVQVERLERMRPERAPKRR
jgi:hypothetical protein